MEGIADEAVGGCGGMVAIPEKIGIGIRADARPFCHETTVAPIAQAVANRTLLEGGKEIITLKQGDRQAGG
jgi:7-keto-8-aminopelargonate synthetase-like enzyme